MSESAVHVRHESFASQDVFLHALLGARSLGGRVETWIESAKDAPRCERSVVDGPEVARVLDALIGAYALHRTLERVLPAAITNGPAVEPRKEGAWTRSDLR